MEAINQLEDVDVMLFFSRNLVKKKLRVKKMVLFLIIMLLFVSLELSINGKCFLDEEKQMYLSVDLIMYIGVIMIAIIEIAIQLKKIYKKSQQQIRLRAKLCKITIYQLFVLFIFILSFLHILVQVYYFCWQFNQCCFYFKGKINDYAQFVIVKSILFSIFLIVEIFIILFLCWIFKENYKAYKNPQKFRESTVAYNSMSNNTVLKTK